MHTTRTERRDKDANSAAEDTAISLRRHWPTPNCPTGGKFDFHT